MKVLYLGTAAAEGVPAVFCQCPTCIEAEKRGGKDLRMRSSVMINDRLLVDVSPDLYAAKLRYHLDLGNVRNIVITHAHMDHFNREELSMYSAGFAHVHNREKIHLWGSDYTRRVWEEYIDTAIMKEPSMPKFFEFHVLKPFDSVEIEGVRVTALPAIHSCPESLIYAFDQGDVRYLYANDTGLFPADTWAWLKEQAGMPFTCVSLDSTMGFPASSYNGHMTLDQNISVRERMIAEGSATADTQFICHHFSHNGHALQAETEAYMNPKGFDVAYDGMILDL